MPTECTEVPRYFFHLDGDGNPGRDEDGAVLAGPEQARAEAVVFIGELLHDAGGGFWNAPGWHLRVTDAAGATVCLLTIRGEM